MPDTILDPHSALPDGLVCCDKATLCPVNKAMLPVIRHFLNALLKPKTMGWRIAQTAAIGTWGEARGLAIAYDTQKFLSAVLMCRSVPLDFNDPLDLGLRDQLKGDEVAILGLLSAMRADETARARARVLYLTQGQMRAVVVQSALKLAKRLDFDTSGAGPHTRPVLRVVK